MNVNNGIMKREGEAKEGYMKVMLDDEISKEGKFVVRWIMI